MKKYVLCISALLLTAFSLHAAPYDMVNRKNVHISATGGLSIPMESDTFSVAGGAEGRGYNKWELGSAAEFAVGYTWDNWRFELEYGYRGFDSDSASGLIFDRTAGVGFLASGPGIGQMKFHSIMVNVAYDWFFTEQWYWYNGIGFGMAFGKLDHNFFAEDKSDSAFAFQVMTGVGYQILENLDIYGGYRMFRVTDMDFRYNIGGIDANLNVDGFWLNQIEAGLRLRF